MAKLRLIHTQTVPGDILIADIDQGLPIQHLDMTRKQDVYVNFHKKSFGTFKIEEDVTVPGYIDLVLSDKVRLSHAHGNIAGMVKAGFITAVEVPTGTLNAPVITTAEQDITGGADGTDDFRVEIVGTTFTSMVPAVSSVSLTDGTTIVSLTSVEITAGGGTFSDTSIIIPSGVHGFATDGSADITSVTVSSNGQPVTEVVVAL